MSKATIHIPTAHVGRILLDELLMWLADDRLASVHAYR